MIDFNVPPFAEASLVYIRQACQENRKICGDGPYTKSATEWLEKNTGRDVLLTTSCSHALDMMALLLDIAPGDEVILPSYNFVSAANAFVLRGAKCVFTDIRPDTMNMDERLIEQAITKNTKAIFVMHYAGVSCEMDTILDIGKKHSIPVIEDAAQGMMASYKKKPLGTLGLLGAYSFHETKNYSMGEGGCLIINDKAYTERAEIIREKGTDRSRFYRGQIDKYSWCEMGSSYLPSDINAAYLLGQLAIANEINAMRITLWDKYYASLKELADAGRVALPHVPEGCTHNGHMFYIKCADLADRSAFIQHMKSCGISCVFHYVPLHSSHAGQKHGVFAGEDRYTTKESERLVRLPLYYGLDSETQQYIIDCAKKYFSA